MKGGAAPTHDEGGLQLSKKWVSNSVVCLMMTVVDASMHQALSKAETANTRAEFEAKSTKHKEFYKAVESMYNCYVEQSTDPLSPWIQQPVNVFRKTHPELVHLTPARWISIGTGIISWTSGIC